MPRAGDACCDMLVRYTAMFAEQVSVEMGCSLLDEGAGSRGENSQREKKCGEVLRSTVAAMVRRGCMACSAVKCRKEDSLRGWRTTGCLQESGGFFFS